MGPYPKHFSTLLLKFLVAPLDMAEVMPDYLNDDTCIACAVMMLLDQFL